jgi:hypothetical protein
MQDPPFESDAYVTVGQWQKPWQELEAKAEPAAA